MRIRCFVLLFAAAFFAMLPVCTAQTALTSTSDYSCHAIAGVLMTDINAIPLPTPANGTNLGPAFGDLHGAVSATILGQNADGSFNVQHYWVSSEGDVINFKQAILHPVYLPLSPGVVAVPWGHYFAYIIPGGTGKYKDAYGVIDCFGMADFNALTLVLRYRGTLCQKPAAPPTPTPTTTP
jgi:hypothetical protein